MPARSRSRPAQQPSVLRGDINAPIGKTTIFGHTLVLDGGHFDVSIADRWMSFDAERERLMKEERLQDALDLLFEIFADAILPANPQWTRETLRTTFVPVIQRRVMDSFFSWRLQNLDVTVETVREAPAEFPEAAARRAM